MLCFQYVDKEQCIIRVLFDWFLHMSPVWEIHFKLLFYNCQSESEQELESTSWNPSYIPSGSGNVFLI
jgi:hypothetical protein